MGAEAMAALGRRSRPRLLALLAAAVMVPLLGLVGEPGAQGDTPESLYPRGAPATLTVTPSDNLMSPQPVSVSGAGWIGSTIGGTVPSTRVEIVECAVDPAGPPPPNTAPVLCEANARAVAFPDGAGKFAPVQVLIADTFAAQGNVTVQCSGGTSPPISGARPGDCLLYARLSGGVAEQGAGHHLTFGTPSSSSSSSSTSTSTSSSSSSSTTSTTALAGGLSITGVSPNEGSAAGSTAVVITGRGFADVTAVTFDSTPAASFHIDSPTQIAAVTPPHPAGVVHVTVRIASAVASPNGAADRFRYITGSWAALPPMQKARMDHSATVLADGKRVLAVGGLDEFGNYQASAEIYDPDANTWKLTADMPTSVDPLNANGCPLTVPCNVRARHTAVLLQPRFCQSPTLPLEHKDYPCGSVLVTGGEGPGTVPAALSSSVIFNPSANGGAGAWRPTGAMSTGRVGHTATLLDNGMVLVAGGRAGASRERTASAEIYDPEKGTWMTIGSMLTRREYHTATVLSDGTVLVAGGTGGDTGSSQLILSSSEVYNPNATKDPWTTVNPMNVARFHHSAARLSDGTVLVTGGRTVDSESRTTQSADLYDPKTHSWTATTAVDTCDPPSPSCVGREDATPVVLPAGVVLLVGGFGYAGPTPVNSAEAYDLGARTWSPALPLNSCQPPGSCPTRGQVQSSRVDPQSPASNLEIVTTTGVTTSALADGSVLVAGGVVDKVTTAAAELYVPTSVQVVDRTPAINSVSPRGGPTLGGTKVRVVGRALVSAHTVVRIGGLEVAPDELSDTVLTFTAPAQPQGTVPLTVITNGGTSPGGVTTDFTYSIGAFDPSASTSRPDGVRHGFTATLLDPPFCHESPVPADHADYPCGAVLVAGGGRGEVGQTFRSGQCSGQALYWSPAPLSSAELYDPVANAWIEQPPMRTARFHHTATLLPNGDVLIAGGGQQPDESPQAGAVAESYLKSAELFHPVKPQPAAPGAPPRTGAWSAAPDMAAPHAFHTATALQDGSVLISGGTAFFVQSPTTPVSEVYDPRTHAWTRVGAMNADRAGHSATLLPDGKVLVAGGFSNINPLAPCPSSTIEPLKSAEVYDPSIGRWSSANSMAAARWYHTASLITGDSCSPNCGKVLVVGGRGGSALLEPEIPSTVQPPSAGGPSQVNPNMNNTAELYDPATGAWTDANVLNFARAYHTATVLPSGKVLVTGGARRASEDRCREIGGTVLPRRSSQGHSQLDTSDATSFRAGDLNCMATMSEVFDPATGNWNYDDGMRAGRFDPLAVLLDGPDCRAPSPPAYCGNVLITNGEGALEEGAGTADRYVPAPTVHNIDPSIGNAKGGDAVTIAGTGMTGSVGVKFDGVLAPAVTVRSPTELLVTTPPRPHLEPGRSTVEVLNAGGTSRQRGANPSAHFTFAAGPDTVELKAAALSESEIQLDFKAADDGTGADFPATDYIVKQSRQPITSANFDSAPALCDVVCTFPPARSLSIVVTGLRAGTEYHYALKARNPLGVLGRMSNDAFDTTKGGGTTPVTQPPPSSTLPSSTLPPSPPTTPPTRPADTSRIVTPSPPQPAFPASPSLGPTPPVVPAAGASASPPPESPPPTRSEEVVTASSVPSTAEVASSPSSDVSPAVPTDSPALALPPSSPIRLAAPVVPQAAPGSSGAQSRPRVPIPGLDRLFGGGGPKAPLWQVIAVWVPVLALFGFLGVAANKRLRGTKGPKTGVPEEPKEPVGELV